MNIRRFTFNPFGVGTYVLWDAASGDGVVVDPGMSNASECGLFDSFIAGNNIRITRIINTHLHLDHCWGNHYVADKYGVRTYGNRADAFLGGRTAQQALMFGLEQGQFKPVEIDCELKDGDTVLIGQGRLDVLQVPGHSPGSIALYDAGDGFVITGDALFRCAIGRTDLPGGDYATLVDSVRSKLLTLPENTVVYPGHEETSTIGFEKSNNPYLRQ